MPEERKRPQRTWYLGVGLLMGSVVNVLYWVKYGNPPHVTGSMLVAAVGTWLLGVLMGWILWRRQSRSQGR